jgi:ketosteroid isomerase-like protein
MNTTQHPEVQAFIYKYAAVLNAGDIQQIAGYFAAKGVFMPNSFPTFNYGEQFKNNTSSFFSKKRINIKFDIIDIQLIDTLALVSAAARTESTDLDSQMVTTTLTRDFFVLQTEGSEWKILRYIFNND